MAAILAKNVIFGRFLAKNAKFLSVQAKLGKFLPTKVAKIYFEDFVGRVFLNFE